MPVIERGIYLKELVSRMHDGRVKAITGIRACGKAFLLGRIFRNYLLSNGVPADHIIELALDEREYLPLRSPDALSAYIKARLLDSGRYYVFLEEFQLAYRIPIPGVNLAAIPEEDRDLAYTTVYDVLAGLIARPNLDVYVTASDARALSENVPSHFRDRFVEIRMVPLRFLEFYPFSGLEKDEAWAQYSMWGGMPLAVLEPDEDKRRRYLKGFVERIFREAVSAHCAECADGDDLGNLFRAVSSSIGARTNPSKLAEAMHAAGPASTGCKTAAVERDLPMLEHAFLIRKARCLDITGKTYQDGWMKYYAADAGLRNAWLGIEPADQAAMQENILFNELLARGYRVDTGTVRVSERKDGKRRRVQREVDFAADLGRKKVYIQSAHCAADAEERRQAIAPLMRCGDFFPRIVVSAGNERPHTDEPGFHYMGILPFLLDPDSAER